MLIKAWLRKVDAVTATLEKAMSGQEASSTCVSAEHHREAVAKLSRLFLGAPAQVDRAFRGLREDELRSEMDRWVNQFGRHIFRPILTDSVKQTVLTMAGYVRALDRDLVDLLRSHSGPVDDPETRYRTEAGQAYVVPRAIPRSTAEESQPFSKRGLLIHRVLPLESAGLAVRLTEHRTARKDDRAVFGAALFQNLQLTIVKSWDKFHLEGIICSDQLDTISRQITDAFEAGCTLLAWPELMVPPQARRHIVKELGQAVISAESNKVPGLVVAGTWHEKQDDDTWKNIGRVFNGAGKLLLSFAKVNPFYYKCGERLLEEDISTENEINILFTDFGVVAFCICKDFCDSTFSAFDSLDVDWFVVPSLGNQTTMDGHRSKAQSVKHNYEAKTFVVQQHLDNSSEGTAEPLGWVLAHSNFTKLADDLAQDTVWKTY